MNEQRIMPHTMVFGDDLTFTICVETPEGIEVTFRVTYDYTPEEAPSKDSPGCDADCVIEKVERWSLFGFWDECKNEWSIMEKEADVLTEILEHHAEIEKEMREQLAIEAYERKVI